MMKMFMKTAVAVVAALVAVQTASAAIITVPTGLNPGDPYRLVFVTSTTTTATDTTAEYYNNFVYNLAVSVPELAALNTTWTVMGNLNGSDTWANTGTAGNEVIPIYNLNDQLFAANYTDLRTTKPPVPVLFSELGTQVINNPQDVGRVWTGMGESGGAPSMGSYIGNGGATGNTGAGRPDDAHYTWGWHGLANTQEQHLYAMSGVIPEPATFGMLGAAAIAMLLRRRFVK